VTGRVSAAIAIAIGLAAGPAADAQACTLPPNPAGHVEFSLDPPDYYVGDSVPLFLTVASQEESAFVDPASVSFQIDGPAGPSQVPDPVYPNAAKVSPPAAGSYSVTVHWTETCDDGVDPPVSRTLASLPATFTARALGPPDVAVTRRSDIGGAKGLQVAPLCPSDPAHAVDEPLVMSARVRTTGPRRVRRTVKWTQPHGCAHRDFMGERRIDIARGRRQQSFVSVDVSYRGLLLTGLPPARASVRLTIESGGRSIASVTVKLSPAGRHSERLRVLSARCPLMPSGCLH
jgi:hypothetical protein